LNASGQVTRWLARREREALAYLIEENRCLRRQLGGRRLHLTDDDRRRLGARGRVIRTTSRTTIRMAIGHIHIPPPDQPLHPSAVLG
jgi:hypothetical protein